MRLLALVLLACLAAPAALAEELVGLWSGTARSRGGLAPQWIFAPSGVATRSYGAVVDYRYGIQGSRLSLTTLDENQKPTAEVTTQDFTLIGDSLTMNPTKPEGRQLMKRVGQPFPGTHPIVGEWSFKHFSGGMAYMRFGRTGLAQLSIPFETAAGSWVADGLRLTTQLKDAKPVAANFRLEKGVLEFRDDGKDAKFRRFDF